MHGKPMRDGGRNVVSRSSPVIPFRFRSLGRLYRHVASDIVYVKVMGTHILVLNTLETSMDLLDRRSTKYSSRHWFVMAQELAGWKWLPGMMPYGKAWHERRKLFQKHLMADPSMYRY